MHGQGEHAGREARRPAGGRGRGRSDRRPARRRPARARGSPAASSSCSPLRSSSRVSITAWARTCAAAGAAPGAGERSRARHASPSPVRSRKTSSRLPCRRRGELRGRAADDQPAVVDDVHPVGQPLGLLHVVRRQHHRHAGVAQLLEQLPGRTPRLRVHARGRLVDEHDLGPADHAPWPGRAAAAGRPRAAGTASARSRRAPAGSPSASRSSGWACSAGDVAQHLHRRAPRSRRRRPAASRRSGGAGRARSRTGSSPSTRTVPCCGRR